MVDIAVCYLTNFTYFLQLDHILISFCQRPSGHCRNIELLKADCIHGLPLFEVKISGAHAPPLDSTSTLQPYNHPNPTFQAD
jgi:hypothetical protein